MQRLYHGTLARNVPSIRAHGLVPQKGSWTKAFYNDAPDLLYAVDEGRKARAEFVNQHGIDAYLNRGKAA